VTHTRWAVAAAAAAAAVALLLLGGERRAFLSGAGLAQGALIAAIAIGIVLTYQGSGVINLANAAIAMYAAYTYALLRTNGDLFLPPLPNPLAPLEWLVPRLHHGWRFDAPDIPVALSLGGEMGFGLAFAISITVCITLGLALHSLVFRPLRTAPPLAKVVASVGVFLLLQAIVLRRFSSSPRAVPSLPIDAGAPLDLRFLTISRGQLAVVIVVVCCTCALSWVFRSTRFGLATRAAAENETAAVVLGYSPDRLAAINWVLSTVLTGTLGILVASISSNIDPIVIAALIVPALTAALVGRCASFTTTTLTAFLLGMQLPLVQYWSVNAAWFPRVDGLPIPGVEAMAPMLLIVVLLWVRGDALPGRGSTEGGRMPKAPPPTRWSLVVGGPLLIALTALGAVTLSPSIRMGLTTTLIGVILCLSVVVITGYVGQISLAPMAFAGISAFVVAELSATRGWPFPVPILAGTAVATAVGITLALPALRIRGVSLAIVTLAVSVSADRALFANPAVNGGLAGAPVTTPAALDQSNREIRSLLGIPLGDGRQPNPMTTLACLLVAAALCYSVAALRRSALGSRMLAVRSDERAAAASGIDVAKTKATAFALSAALAGIGGGVMAYRSGGAHAEAFTFLHSLSIFAVAYLGGISRVGGALIGGVLVAGGVLFTVLQEVAGVPSQFTLLLGGLALIATAIVHPDGVASDLAKLRWRRARGSQELSSHDLLPVRSELG
jgi:branched-chain amino acid transport system permease protein